jgi:hypothetical protein
VAPGARHCIRTLATTARNEAVRKGLSPTLRRAYDEAVSDGSVLHAVDMLANYRVLGNVADSDDGPNEVDMLYDFLRTLRYAGDAAVRKEHMGVLLLLRSHLSNFSPGSEHTSRAVREGRLDVLKELYAKGYGISSCAYDDAARSNRMDIVL